MFIYKSKKETVSRLSLSALLLATGLLFPLNALSQTAGAADVSIVKTAAETPIESGTVQTFTIVVTNNGPDAAQGTVVNDSLPSGANFVSVEVSGATDPEASSVQAGGVVNAYIGTMAPNTSATVTIQAEVNGNGRAINTATVRTQDGCDPDPTNNFSAVEVTQTAGGQGPGADLEITKVDLQDPVEVNGLLTYEIEVVNTGPADAQDVVITEKLPSGVDFVGATSSGTEGFVELDGIVTYLIGDLANGEAANVSVTVRPRSAGLIVNAVSARSSTNQSGPLSDNTVVQYTTVTGLPVCTCCANLPDVDLEITKTDSPDPVVAGENLTYTITVRNVGTTPATGVLVTDELPEGVIPVSHAVTPAGACSRNGRTVTCTLGTLAPGASSVVTLNVIPNEVGTLTNTAVVRSNEADSDTTNNTSTAVETNVQPAAQCSGVDLTGMFKMAPTLECQTNKKGKTKCDVLAWFVLQNVGDVDAKKVTVKFYLSDDTIFDAGDKKLKNFKFKRVPVGAMIQIDPRFKKQKTNPVGQYIIAVIDDKNKIAECNEDNNVAVSPPIIGAF